MTHSSSRFLALAFIALLIVPSLMAHVIHVDAGGYKGKWNIGGNSQVGSATIDLPEGAYNMVVAWGAGIPITIDAQGAATTTAPNRATCMGNTISFNITEVIIQANGYTGKWEISWGPKGVIGDGSILLIPDLTYNLKVAWGAGINFTVDENGNVSTTELTRATCSGNTLSFNTATLNVQANGYMGKWEISWGPKGVIGDGSILLIPDLPYNLKVAWGAGINFTVDENGNVSTTELTRATCSGNTLSFNTTTLNVQANGYSGKWEIGQGPEGVIGDGSILLIPDLPYQFGVAWGAGFPISIDAQGEVSTNSESAIAQGNTLSLQTGQIEISPTPETTQWKIAGLYQSSVGAGIQTLTVGLRYSLTVSNGQAFFEVMSPCEVIPSNMDIGSANFDLKCIATEEPDSDGDGISDPNDNCVDIPNPDQLDQDMDDLGDVCDEDDDGDGISDLTDNCPAIANLDQADADQDGIGDACDNDDDGDGVNDDIDNCLWLANTDQFDGDADGLGDACDPDDDNDTIEDDVDNCPTVANVSQADFDSDGEGDACDGDTDGDGVQNETDLCDGTPNTLSVDINGCSGIQRVQYLCDPAMFRNHGQYVKCVAHEATEVKHEGLISEKERARLVSQAAKHK